MILNALNWWEEDLEKPIITNHVVTDGEHIQFFTYQLNTVALDPATEKAELFGEIENKKNNVLCSVGQSDQIFYQIVSF